MYEVFDVDWQPHENLGAIHSSEVIQGILEYLVLPSRAPSISGIVIGWYFRMRSTNGL
jgi:hypothetical protein